VAAPNLDLALTLTSIHHRRLRWRRGLLTEFAVNALVSSIHVRQAGSDQVELPLAAESVVRYVWESRFGPMLIEVKEGRAYVNGQAVQSADLTPSPGGAPPT
jgi:hypothetical protein